MADTEWVDDTFFPLGVWGAYVDVETYWQRYADCGMRVFWNGFNTNGSAEALAAEYNMWSFYKAIDCGSRSVGTFVNDEMDMWCGGWAGTDSCGWNAWANEPADGFGSQPDGAQNGFTVTSRLVNNHSPDVGGPFYINYGKGIAYGAPLNPGHVFFTGNNPPNYDSNPAHVPFTFQMASVDAYYYGDANIASEADGWEANIPVGQIRRAINYGQQNIARQRAFSAFGFSGVPQQLIGGTLDVGAINPGGPDLPSLAVMEGAAWASIIYEARFLTWFSHAEEPGSNDFQEMLGTSTTTYANNMRSTLTGICSRIQALAPVLNTQSYEFDFGSGVDTMLKAKDGFAYIFAMQTRQSGTSSTPTFTLTGSGINGTTAEVLNESRSVNITAGSFSDNFANEYTHHIYKVAI
jgi:hypothetical protein